MRGPRSSLAKEGLPSVKGETSFYPRRHGQSEPCRLSLKTLFSIDQSRAHWEKSLFYPPMPPSVSNPIRDDFQHTRLRFMSESGGEFYQGFARRADPKVLIHLFKSRDERIFKIRQPRLRGFYDGIEDCGLKSGRSNPQASCAVFDHRS
jgi:hypothetical protein